VLYFTANPNGEAETIKVALKPRPKLKKPNFDFDFSTLAIKGRGSQGNNLSKYPVKKVTQAEAGISTLGARDIWYDDSIRRLNTEGRGRLLGAFLGDDKILTIMQSGNYRLFNYDLANHFEEDLLIIEKFLEAKPVTAVYYNGEKKFYYLKRFQVEVTDKKIDFVGDEPDSKLVLVSTDWLPRVLVMFDEKLNNRTIDDEEIIASEFIESKSHKAKGKRITVNAIKKLKLLDPLPYTPPEEPENVEKAIVTEVPIDLPSKERKPLHEEDDDAKQMTIDF
jgi:topoisomerase-4 subunit A